MILLVVWSANGDATVVLLLPRLVPIYQMTILTDVFVWVILSSIWTNRARCTLYKTILDLFNEETLLEKVMVELVYKFDERSTTNVWRGESIVKVRLKKKFGPQTYLYMDTSPDNITPCSVMCMWGKYSLERTYSWTIEVCLGSKGLYKVMSLLKPCWKFTLSGPDRQLDYPSYYGCSAVVWKCFVKVCYWFCV